MCAPHILIHQNVICTHLSDKRGQFDYTYSFWFVICCEHSQIIDYFAVKSKRLQLLFYPCIFRNVLLMLLLLQLMLLGLHLWDSGCCPFFFFFVFCSCSFFSFVRASFSVSFISNNEIKWKRKFLFTTFLTLFSAFVLNVCVVELFAFLCSFVVCAFFSSFHYFFLVLHIDSHMACANICFEVVIFHWQTVMFKRPHAHFHFILSFFFCVRKKSGIEVLHVFEEKKSSVHTERESER